ncbi:hypothetical protein ACOIC6_27865, partial [Klebsiella pneumoniae]
NILHHQLKKHPPTQKQHQQKPLKQKKIPQPQNPQKTQQPPIPIQQKHQKQILQHHNNQPPHLPPPQPQKHQKHPLQHKIHHQLKKHPPTQ